MVTLIVDNLGKNFGGLRVVSGLSFQVNQNEIVSLIGPNGAGKTTVLNLLTGITPPDGGDIQFEGQSLLGLSPHQITRLGIARTFQTLRLFLNMSIIENVMSAAYTHTRANLLHIIFRTPAWRQEEASIRALAEETLSFFGDRLVGYRFDQPAYSLSYANRRRLEIARAMATRPKLLLLDEPAAGMNPSETREITELIGKLRDEGGYTILLIEHDMTVVRSISDRVIALDYGQKIAEGDYAAVVNNELVIEAYLGRKERVWSKS
jgi:ABC-type branched-subunit amino acid transport system ATPase component